MAKEEVVLLTCWASSYANRVRIALEEKGVQYQTLEEDLSHKSHLLLQHNPLHKKVPVLIHNRNPVIESAIIIEYIDESWTTNAPPILPLHPLDRANARFWVDFIDKKIYECGSRVWRGKGEAQAAAKEEFIGYLKLLEAELGEKAFFGGDALGYVDIALVPFSAWFHTYEIFGELDLEEHCPELMAWMKRCMEKESVSKVLPDPQRVFQFASDLKKKMEM